MGHNDFHVPKSAPLHCDLGVGRHPMAVSVQRVATLVERPIEWWISTCRFVSVPIVVRVQIAAWPQSYRSRNLSVSLHKKVAGAWFEAAQEPSK